MSKISKGKQGEELVVKELNKIKVHHHLLNDVTLINAKSDMTHQIDHILIHPHGVFIIETKNYSGEITIEDGAWFKTIKKQKKRISNPLLQNKSHEITLFRAVKGLFKATPIVVFVKNNAPYLPNDNAINLEDLLLFIDSYPYEKELSKVEIDNIKKTIENVSSEVSLKEHLENIKTYKQYRKEQQEEMRIAIEQGICPYCESKILTNGVEFMCSKCNFHFKL